ncbi:hypothetical protein COU80_02815 [Candidatus Peregrinibacteria bacterium CG10_big_fil_rev_8_21_14_0_10_55_24]|nr:MAG: hypothetical protein COU80_02815 [Candidatus Peregrinibacteria bacterium CG10_big_fil_rev_8_21_14_0_10_55_24]
MKHTPHSFRFVLTAAVLTFLAPLAMGPASVVTQNLPGALVSSVTSQEDLRTEALQDRVRVRRQTRQYWQAIEAYQNRVRAGEEGLTPPSVDDYQSILQYLRAMPSAQEDTSSPAPEGEATHPAATDDSEDDTVSSLTAQELSDQDRLLLRRYVRANSCPESLKNYLPGFFDLCNAMAQDAAKEPRVGLVNVNQQLHSVQYRDILPNTLKARLQMIQQSLNRSSRRTDLPTPMRYEPTYSGEE